MAKAFIVAGLGYGDEGKGSVVDFLVQHFNAAEVIRYNGGPQAAHHVVVPRKTWHCFSQFGSGTFTPGVRTFLSRQMLIKPCNLLTEGQTLREKGVLDAIERLILSPDSYLVTPWHAMVGRMKEVARGENRLGSVGKGVGEAAADRAGNGACSLTVRDLLSPAAAKEKLGRLREEKFASAQELLARHPCGDLREIIEEYARNAPLDNVLAVYREFGETVGPAVCADEEHLHRVFESAQTLVFEGAQGVLLDPRHGFRPYVTKTDATFAGAFTLLQCAPRPKDLEIVRVGVLRAYATRHGAGPFVTHDPSLKLAEWHNAANPWQGEFRVGYFDLPAARYAIAAAGGIDTLALTNLDRVCERPLRVCTAYECDTVPAAELEEFFEVERHGSKTRIVALKPLNDPSEEQHARRTKMLLRSRPAQFKSFPKLGNVRRMTDSGSLPSAVRNFIEYLEESLGTQVSVLSFGPAWSEKLYIPARG